MKIDIVIGLQAGDEAKGKVTHHLLSKNRYTHVARASGGPNCGHTIYHQGKKFVTHHIPSGVFYGITSIIGPGCVVNPITFLEELKMLEDAGISTKGKVLIADTAHVITTENVVEDKLTDKIGSTGTGIMPTYRNKYARCGIRVENCKELMPFICNTYNELYVTGARILIEGAQGFNLCPDHGDYPFVTSSPPTSTYALHSLGLPPQAVRTVNGVAKAYETYVGAKNFQPEGEVFKKIQEVGNEFGATTGRPRQVNWMDLDNLIKAIRYNGVTDLVINKMDVLREVGEWQVIKDGNIINLKNEEGFISFIMTHLPRDLDIYFSDSPHRV